MCNYWLEWKLTVKNKCKRVNEWVTGGNSGWKEKGEEGIIDVGGKKQNNLIRKLWQWRRFLRVRRSRKRAKFTTGGHDRLCYVQKGFTYFSKPPPGLVIVLITFLINLRFLKKPQKCSELTYKLIPHNNSDVVWFTTVWKK